MAYQNNDVEMPRMIKGERKSTIGIMSVQKAATDICANEDPAIASLVSNAIINLDRDGDGRLDNSEVAGQLLKSIKDGMALAEERTRAEEERDVAQEDRDRAAAESKKWRKRSMSLAALAIVLFAGFFGVVIAAINLSKDTKVASTSGRSLMEDTDGNRPFMSKDNHPIATNINEAKFPLAAAAFTPLDFQDKISAITIIGTEGQVYHRKVMSITVMPKESVVLKTLDGDKVTWDLAMNEGQDLFIELEDGTTFTKSAVCAACTGTNVVLSDELMDSMDEFFKAVGAGETSDTTRRLWRSNSEIMTSILGNTNTC